jgi:hypothetical protein
MEIETAMNRSGRRQRRHDEQTLSVGAAGVAHRADLL